MVHSAEMEEMVHWAHLEFQDETGEMDHQGLRVSMEHSDHQEEKEEMEDLDPQGHPGQQAHLEQQAHRG